MLDKTSGHVLPVSGSTKPPPASWTCPQLPDIGIADITIGDLLSTLRRIVDAEERHGREKKVLSAHLSMSESSRTPKKRWFPLHVECTKDEQARGLAIRLVDGGGLPTAAAVKVIERINWLLEEQPKSPFVQRLSNSVSEDDAPQVMDVAHWLSRLDTEISKLTESRPLEPRRQEQLNAIANEFEDRIIDRRDAEVDAENVVGRQEHSEKVDELIESAVRQVVLVCPWLRPDTLKGLVGTMERALKRGVQIFLLWGMDRYDLDSLDQEIINTRVRLREAYPSQFFMSRRSSRTHAKIVVQDDRRALVTSLNFLRPSPDGTLEVGVLISARSEARCPAIERLLYWARSAYPEFSPAQSLYLTRESFCRDHKCWCHPDVQSAHSAAPRGQ